MKSGIRLAGDKLTIQALKSLPARVQNKVIRKALKAAAIPIESEAKARAPVDDGNLRDGIGIKPGKRRKGRVSMLVQSSRASGYENFYGGFHEYGYHRMGVIYIPGVGFRTPKKIGGTKQVRGGETTTYVPPRPYMRPAFESRRAEATAIAAKVIGAEVQREALKLTGLKVTKGGRLKTINR